MDLLIALLPLLIAIVLIIIFKKSALFAFIPTFIITLIIAIFYWMIPSAFLTASIIKGIFTSFELLLIIIGALTLYEVAKASGSIDLMSKYIGSLSKDKRIQAIIIAFSFGMFLEGASGFGTPQALIPPILVSLGFSPILAVVLALLSNSTPVSFGAIGAPITIGLSQTVTDPAQLTSIVHYTALIHGIIGLFLPLLIACIVSKFTEKSFKKGLEVWKFALFAGFSFIVPYMIFAYTLGPEFPSFLGGLIGLFIIIYGASKGWFLGKKNNQKFPVKAFLPYIFASILLVITRIPFIKPILSKVSINFNRILATNVSINFYPLISAGIILFISALLYILIFKIKISKVNLSEVFSKKILRIFIILMLITSIVQIYLNSEVNNSYKLSMPEVIATKVAEISGVFYPLFSPLIGTFGAFIAGSNTVSNLLFSPIQYKTAELLGLPIAIILALQTVGGATGNMIALHNIISASAIVKLHSQEHSIIRKTIIPCLVYSLLAGIIGLILIYLI